MPRVDAGLKELLAPSPALPRGLPKFFPACFPSPTGNKNVQGARPDTGRGNSGFYPSIQDKLRRSLRKPPIPITGCRQTMG